MRTPDRFWALGVAAVLVVAAPGCRRDGPKPQQPDPELRRDLELTIPQALYLDELAAAADAAPNDFDLRKASGMAHLRFTLSGVLSLQDRAESDLEAAFAIRRDDDELDFALGRFYNLRAVAGDDSKAAQQVEVYSALLGDQEPTAMSSRDFVAWSFLQLGVILSHRTQGRLFKALSVVKTLEAELERRARAAPEDVELWALAGNFSFFFAGNIPIGREDRVRAAVEYFEHVRAHWEQLRPGAKDPEHCPNTYENFMFELAEGHLVLEEAERAREIYDELATPSKPVTRAKEQIAFVSAERLRNSGHYVGKMELMPPWPSDVGNCVVCHAYTADVPLTTLFVREPIRLQDIPTSATPKPLPRLGPLPDVVRQLVDDRCVRCHQPGGEGVSYADFATDEGVLRHSSGIVRRVAASEMPPAEPLAPDQQRIILEWAGVR